MTGGRPISSHELDVVRWLLANGALKNVSEYRVESLQDARVVPCCTCGCASIDFHTNDPNATGTQRPRLRGSNILAEAFTLWPDGFRAGVMLWGTEGRLIGIELYELGGGAIDRFPTLETLRRWEDYYGPDE
jgi:hypothetical protein